MEEAGNMLKRKGVGTVTLDTPSITWNVLKFHNIKHDIVQMTDARLYNYYVYIYNIIIIYIMCHMGGLCKYGHNYVHYI